MTWKSALFRQFYVAQGSANAANSYCVNLRKADNWSGGLDEKIAALGGDGVKAWASTQTEGPFVGVNASNVRSAVRKYVDFVESLSPDAETALMDEVQVETATSDGAPAETVFRYEQELQAAIRRQISSLEPGLEIVDGGNEHTVSTGRIDILARDPNGQMVVIELKAGVCPSGAIEQVLAYAADLDASTNFVEASRAILIAGEFRERTLAAARRISGLKLLTYGLNVSFFEAD